MEREVLKEPKFSEEIVGIVRSGMDKEAVIEQLRDYHENDIAQSLAFLTSQERRHLYKLLGAEWTSEIFSHVEEPKAYIEELSIDQLAAVINEMDSDDAVDLLEDIDDTVKNQLYPILKEDVKADIRLIHSYDEDEIGSLITNNYICISKDLNIRQAMHELIRQAGDNDNISTIYVTDKQGKFSGAIDLKDLIIARENDDLDDLIIYSYPYLIAHEKISENIELIKDYAEDSLPVLNDQKCIIGILTAQDVIEAVDDEMGEDYAKLAGLTSEEDLKIEPITINNVLEESIASFYTILKEKQISPKIIIPQKKIVRNLDRSAISRIFANLLNNVVKYSNGDLEVTLFENGEIHFINHASNLTEIEVGKLFDRFYTVNNARNSTGLGLSISKALVEKMNGTISAEYNNEMLNICIVFDL